MADKNFEHLKPRIIVMGVGGAGTNAVNNMIRSNLEGVEFIVANTDAQALRESLAPERIQLGHELTQGLGAGSKPDIGSAAAEETLEHIENAIKGAHMVFITAGMGGGTGTGAAPVIAKAARALGILTVGVVTKPFHFEGGHRMKMAEMGLAELQKNVDTLIIIPNQNLFRLADSKTTFADAFNMADNVLYSGVRGVTDLMIMPGLINLDFADVRTVMSEMGKAMMGTGEAEGENRALTAAEAAIANPLLDEVSLRGARGVLINITGGMDITLFEVDEAANHIREQVDPGANIIFGSTFDDRLNGKIRVSVVATGIDPQSVQANILAQTATAIKSPALNQHEFDLNSEILAPNVLASEEETEELEEVIEIAAPVSVAPATAAEPAAALANEPLPKPSFFEKIGFKRKRTNAAAEEKAEFSVVQSEGESSTEDMDIPAFLRRKK